MNEPKKRMGRPPKVTRATLKETLPELHMPTKVNDRIAPKRRVKEGIVNKKTSANINKNSLSNLKDPPTKYREKYCDMLPALYEKHKTVYGVCGELDICDQTYGRWRKIYPQFDEAHRRCYTRAKGNYFKFLYDNFENKNVNDTLVVFFGKTYFKLNDKPTEEDEDPKNKELLEQTIELVDRLTKLHEKEY